MIRRVVAGLLLLAALAAAQWAQVQFAPAGATYSQILLNLPDNRLLLLGTEDVTSSVNPVVHTRMAAWAIPMVASSPVGQPPAVLLPGGNGNDMPHAASVDANGNIWIAGETDSDDFPLVNPIVAPGRQHRHGGRRPGHHLGNRVSRVAAGIVWRDPGTVLYAGPNQINVQVPFENFEGSVSVSGQTGSASFQPPLTRSIGIFTTDGVHAAALNQDGSVNSQFNSARPGSVVTIYGTGAVWPAGMQDGANATEVMPLDQERNQFQMVDGIGTPLTILYAGAAPGIINGVFRINVQLTPGVLMPLKMISTNPGSSEGTLNSNAVQVYLRQP